VRGIRMRQSRRKWPKPHGSALTVTPGICSCMDDPVLSVKFDAMYCPKCLVWLENKCADVNCVLCKARPATAKGDLC
jgi:hypothetical protein